MKNRNDPSFFRVSMISAAHSARAALMTLIAKSFYTSNCLKSPGLGQDRYDKKFIKRTVLDVRFILVLYDVNLFQVMVPNGLEFRQHIGKMVSVFIDWAL